MTFDVTSADRPPHESRSQDHLAREQLLRIANAILDSTGVHRGQGNVLELVRRYERQVNRNGWAFFAYFTNALLITEPTRARAQADPEVQRVICCADPTGETAVPHVAGAARRMRDPARRNS